jgi:hypothetical protein
MTIVHSLQIDLSLKQREGTVQLIPAMMVNHSEGARGIAGGRLLWIVAADA